MNSAIIDLIISFNNSYYSSLTFKILKNYNKLNGTYLYGLWLYAYTPYWDRVFYNTDLID